MRKDIRKAGKNIFSYETQHIDRVFSGRIWRRVSQLQFGQIGYGAFEAYYSSNNVDAFIYAFYSYGLGAQDAAGVIEKQLHRQRQGAWIVRGMRIGVGIDGTITLS